MEAVTSRSRNGWQVKFGKLVPIWSVFPPTQRWVKVIEYISMCVDVCGTRANAMGKVCLKGDLICF